MPYGDKFYPGPYGGCPANITGVVSGGKLDPAAAGFQVNLLKSAFELQNVNLRGEGECDDQGKAKNPQVVLDSNWIHSGTGFMVSITQRVASSTPVADVLSDGGATFTSGGYTYSVYVNSYGGPIPLDSKPLPEPVTTSAASGSGGSVSVGSGQALPYPGGQAQDPRVADVVKEVMQQLAPSLTTACFYQQTAGSWDDLKALGIGDPRPAIPQGLTEQYAQFIVFTAPPPSCNAPKLTAGSGFNASFGDNGADPKGGGYLSISANSIPDGQPAYPGYADAYSASWSNGKFQFNVSAGGPNSGLGQDTVRAVARALDPGFDNACLMTNRQLTEAEFLALGFKKPAVPDGFSIGEWQFNASEVNGNCKPSDLPAGAGNSYGGNWSMSTAAGDAFIGVGINRQTNSPKDPTTGTGYISDYGLGWSDGNGTYFSVNGKAVDGKVTRDMLIAVAKSIDPSLDVTKLQEQPGAVGIREG